MLSFKKRKEGKEKVFAPFPNLDVTISCWAAAAFMFYILHSYNVVNSDKIQYLDSLNKKKPSQNKWRKNNALYFIKRRSRKSSSNTTSFLWKLQKHSLDQVPIQLWTCFLKRKHNHMKSWIAARISARTELFLCRNSAWGFYGDLQHSGTWVPLLRNSGVSAEAGFYRDKLEVCLRNYESLL